MKQLYGTASASTFDSWVYDDRFRTVVNELDEFFRKHQRGYAERFPQDTAERRMTGWEPEVWYQNPYLLNAVASIEDQINVGETAVIEIGTFDSLTGTPVTASFTVEDLEWALVDVDQDVAERVDLANDVVPQSPGVRAPAAQPATQPAATEPVASPTK